MYKVNVATTVKLLNCETLGQTKVTCKRGFTVKDVPNGVALLDVTQRGHRTLNVSVHFTDSSHPSVTGETASHTIGKLWVDL